MRGSKPRNAGIIKHVYSDRSLEEIEEEIISKYENCEVELFKKDEEFTGTIKIKFNSEGDYQDALDNRVKVFEQIYIMEKYKFRPRVIMCRKCQKYGHVARVCRSDHPVCGFCKSEDHDTDRCNAREDQHKCYHCNGNHRSGHKACTVHQTKEDEIKTRFHNEH